MLVLVLTLGGAVTATVGSPGLAHAARWSEVDRLAGEQKLEAGATEVAKLRVDAQRAGNDPEWARALIREVQLRTGLHGYETAVRFLRDEKWPAGLLPRLTLDLFYANALVQYIQQYSWEINQREKVESKGTVDLRRFLVRRSNHVRALDHPSGHVTSDGRRSP